MPRCALERVALLERLHTMHATTLAGPQCGLSNLLRLAQLRDACGKAMRAGIISVGRWRQPAKHASSVSPRVQRLTPKEPDSGFWLSVPSPVWHKLAALLRLEDLMPVDAQGNKKPVPLVAEGDLLEEQYQDQPHDMVRCGVHDY